MALRVSLKFRVQMGTIQKRLGSHRELSQQNKSTVKLALLKTYGVIRFQL